MPRGPCGIEMRMGNIPMHESVSYGPERVHFYVGDFGYFCMATLTIAATESYEYMYLMHERIQPGPGASKEKLVGHETGCWMPQA